MILIKSFRRVKITDKIRSWALPIAERWGAADHLYIQLYFILVKLARGFDLTWPWSGKPCE
jgi:hypothetical protein